MKPVEMLKIVLSTQVQRDEFKEKLLKDKTTEVIKQSQELAVLIASLDIKDSKDTLWIKPDLAYEYTDKKSFVSVILYDRAISIGSQEIGYDIELDKRIFIKTRKK